MLLKSVKYTTVWPFLVFTKEWNRGNWSFLVPVLWLVSCFQSSFLIGGNKSSNTPYNGMLGLWYKALLSHLLKCLSHFFSIYKNIKRTKPLVSFLLQRFSNHRGIKFRFLVHLQLNTSREEKGNLNLWCRVLSWVSNRPNYGDSKEISTSFVCDTVHGWWWCDGGDCESGGYENIWQGFRGKYLSSFHRDLSSGPSWSSCLDHGQYQGIPAAIMPG